MKKKTQFIVSTSIAVLMLTATVLLLLARDIQATVKTNRLQPGDTFHVVSTTKDPFQDPYIFGGTIINKQGRYIQYINTNGDTCSTNIRIYLRNPKTDKVTVIKATETNQ